MTIRDDVSRLQESANDELKRLKPSKRHERRSALKAILGVSLAGHVVQYFWSRTKNAAKATVAPKEALRAYLPLISSPNDVHAKQPATINGNVAFDRGAEFKGGYIELGEREDLAFQLGSYSVLCWVRRTSRMSKSAPIIAASGKERGWSILLDSSMVSVTLQPESGPEEYSPQFEIDVNRWTLVGLSVDRETLLVRWVVGDRGGDGDLRSSTACFDGSIRLGETNGGLSFGGEMSDLAILGRAMSRDELRGYSKLGRDSFRKVFS